MLRLMLCVLALAHATVASQTLIVFSTVGVYKVSNTGRTELVAPGASFNCSTCSRWQPGSLRIGDDNVLLTDSSLVVVSSNGTLKQSLDLSSHKCFPSHLGPFNPTTTGGSFYVLCKSSAIDSWKPKYIIVVLRLGLYSLQPPQYADGTVWTPSETNSAMVRDGGRGQYFVYISGDSLWYHESVELTPNQIDPPNCSRFSSVVPLEPAGGKFRFAVDCTRDGVKRRFIVGQEGVVEELPTPLVCDSPLVSVPGGSYGITFCGPFTYILQNLTAGTSQYVVRGGIPAGDHVLVFPSSRHVVIGTANQNYLLLDLEAEYQREGSGLTALPNTASAYPRPQAANCDDGTCAVCSTTSGNLCQLFTVGQGATAPTAYNLGSITPDAVIVGHDPAGNGALTSSSPPPSNAMPAALPTITIVVPVATVVVVSLVMVGVVVVVVVVYIYHKRVKFTTPMPESGGERGSTRHSGCGSSNRSSMTDSSSSSSGGDGCSGVSIPHTQQPLTVVV